MDTWIERQRGLIDFAVANLGRRRGRNLGLFLAYTLVVFLLASVVLYGDALRREARALLADAPELVVQRLTAGRHDLMPADWKEKLQGLRGVGAVEGRLWGYHYDPAVAANLTLLVPAGETPAHGRVKLVLPWRGPGGWPRGMCCPCATMPADLMPSPSPACWIPPRNWPAPI